MTEQKLERALRQALPPLDPGPLLIEQIMGQIEPAGAPPSEAYPAGGPAVAPGAPRRIGALRRWLPASLAAAVLISFGFGHWAQQQRQRQARAQLLQGLTIASASLRDARNAVLHSQEHPP